MRNEAIQASEEQRAEWELNRDERESQALKRRQYRVFQQLGEILSKLNPYIVVVDNEPRAMVDGFIFEDAGHVGQPRMVFECPECGGDVLSPPVNILADIGRMLEDFEEGMHWEHRCPKLEREAEPIEEREEELPPVVRIAVALESILWLMEKKEGI